MASEMLQFAAFLAVAGVAFVLWLNIIYLPGRTLERRYDAGESGRGRREANEEEGYSPGKSGTIQSSSDPTR